MLLSNPVFTVRLPVRFQDVDAAGIVFFARVYDYAHDAFVLFMRSIDLPLERILREGRLGIPLVHAEADYTGPLRFGDDVDVAVARPEVRGKSFQMQYALSVAERPCAVVRLTHVATEFPAMTAVRVPDEWRSKLAP